MAISFTLTDTLTQIKAADWDALGTSVFSSHAFLCALEQENCATPSTGWHIRYLLMHSQSSLIGAVPLYLKYHSRGEYVFDQSWAQAYSQHGLAYYPKLVSAIPFTPVSGSRLLAQTASDKLALAQALKNIAAQEHIASLHILFPDNQDADILRSAGFLLRENIQFHWHNPGYPDMEAFLASLTRDKRKKMRQDSRKVEAAKIDFLHLKGAEITPEILAFFYQCYTNTYLVRGQQPYLNFGFFQRWHEFAKDALVLILARQGASPIASALCVLDQGKLYGRYWGSLAYIPGLHFETCYTQTIRYCIEHQIAYFEGGAQGEHKLARGLLPVSTYSAHWIAHPQFAAAIEDFLDRERPAVAEYSQQLQAHSPFKT